MAYPVALTPRVRGGHECQWCGSAREYPVANDRGQLCPCRCHEAR